MEGVELRPDVRPPSGSVPWPFDRVRDGQSDFLQDARTTLAGGKHLLAHAPTGIGKTAVALVAALDYALTADKLVLFLTSRQSHHRIAIETVRRIEAKGPRIPTIDLIAKHSMCLQEGAPSHGRAFQEFCDFKVKSRTCGFFTRDNSAVGAAKSMERFLTALRSERIARKDEFLDVVEAGLRRKGGETRGYTAFVEDLAFAGEDAVRRGVPSHLPEVAEFFVRWRDQEEGILRLVVPGPDGKFAFRLLDPSVLSRSVFDRIHASILMSGTLFPAEMYADLLGIAARRRVLRTYASPFPRENRLLLVSPNVTTLFVKRGKEMHDAIAREIGGIAAVVPGNVAAFFPSYELLGEAHGRLRAARVPKLILVERPDWSKTQRDGALEALRIARTEGGALLLGVQGGSLSEGVDYHDNLLSAVIVVGLPLSPPSVEGEALRDYYARKFGFAKGHDYAVVYPAVNRLLQAAGRAIRSERDRAAIVLLEGRILEPRYARCLPPDFAPARSEGAASEASRFLQPPG